MVIDSQSDIFAAIEAVIVAIDILIMALVYDTFPPNTWTDLHCH